jgi:hypothetical protein
MSPRSLWLAVILASGLVGASVGAAPARESSPSASSSLKIVFRAKSPSLTYSLRCDPSSGTLPRASAACAAIALNPGMIPGRPAPALPADCTLPADSSPPAPLFSIAVTGTYRGQPVAREACFDEEAWLPFLPSFEALDRVRIDRGIGAVSLGESVASVRYLLGAPQEQKQGLQIYETGAVEQVTLGIPVIFAIGYGHSGRVTTVIANDFSLRIEGERPTVTPRASSKLHKWLWLGCGGHHVLLDHRPLNGRAATIITPPVASISTVIVSSTPDAACVAAARTAPAPAG